jgi:DNA-binding NtrC family response regulator
MVAIRILFIDDCADDVFIATHRLTKAGFDVCARTVALENELRDAIIDFHPDIILSDMSLPGFTGLEALNIAHSSSPEVPFLFLCGCAERTTRQALERGAFAIVDKDHAESLPDLIHTALTKAEPVLHCP